MNKAVSPKRVPDSGALFLSMFWVLLASTLFYSSVSLAGEQQCKATHIDAYHKIKYVHDGDSLHLAGGQKVRLIGINTPELARDNRPAEQYGIAARDALRQLLPPGTRVGVQYGRARYDRHRRTLAHLYLEDGRSVQQWLLKNGYAMAIAIPPNLHNVDCYQQAEQHARQRQNGIWQQGVNTLDARALKRGDEGFRLLKGQVTRVKRTKKWLWLTLSKDCALRIAVSDLPHFDDQLVASLAQKTVIARGWLTQRKGRWSIRIKHPSALVVIDG